MKWKPWANWRYKILLKEKDKISQSTTHQKNRRWRRCFTRDREKKEKDRIRTSANAQKITSKELETLFEQWYHNHWKQSLAQTQSKILLECFSKKMTDDVRMSGRLNELTLLRLLEDVVTYCDKLLLTLMLKAELVQWVKFGSV